MQLEQCIYRNLSADDPVSLYHIPSALLGLYQSYKESGYQVIMEAIKNRCHADVQSGCEGHRYGLIECEPTGKTSSFIFMSMLFSGMYFDYSRQSLPNIIG